MIYIEDAWDINHILNMLKNDDSPGSIGSADISIAFLNDLNAFVIQTGDKEFITSGKGKVGNPKLSKIKSVEVLSEGHMYLALWKNRVALAAEIENNPKLSTLKSLYMNYKRKKSIKKII
ncbi:hypothetical protein GXP67_19605 [Rhodocytophaga rosea]|uniref:Uncharacterized protein n=1 Tax=Rhodocytophaga rosea TaxID=2704465 RepID=A0A6C0GM49_9BACT|nr:hypothetical protein [Rhodocytophaga rosea]QHT68692.1 hypothetical protein GXP67_19605 [Rhodocytophaga rosea]